MKQGNSEPKYANNETKQVNDGRMEYIKIDYAMFERLIRDSERLNVVRDFARKGQYLSEKELRSITGVELEKSSTEEDDD